MRKVVIGLLAIFAIAACAGGSSKSIQGQWKLVSYGSMNNQKPAVPDVETSIEVKDGKLNGNVGCNGFGGDYTVDGDTITFSPIMSTMMFCEAVAEQEAELLLSYRLATFTLDGNTLTIRSADGKLSIVLEQK